MRRAPLIVGGGPAGAAAAITLAQGGVRATVLERTQAPTDPLCGGFLSWRTLETLERLGIAADTLNPQRITRVRVFVGQRVVEATLPRPAVAVSRLRLDTLLLAQAMRVGAAVERGVAVRSVEDGVRTADGATLRPDVLFLASGKHDVRGMPRGPDPNRHPVVGLRARLNPTPALKQTIGDAVELHLLRDGYVGVAIQEDGSVNLCLAVAQARLAAAGSPAALLATLCATLPSLSERVGGASDISFDAVANVPYGWRQRTGAHGLFRLGDQAAVIPSLAGEGVGIALASGVGAAAAFLAGGAEAAPAWQRRFAGDAARPLAMAGAARALAEWPAGAAGAAPLLARLPWLIQAVASATRIAHTAA